jgi:hypothetical protein
MLTGHGPSQPSSSLPRLDAAQRPREAGAEVDHANPGRRDRDAGHPRARVGDLFEVVLGGSFAQVAASRRRTVGVDAVHLGDLRPAADQEDLGRERVGVDRDRHIRLRQQRPEPSGPMTDVRRGDERGQPWQRIAAAQPRSAKYQSKSDRDDPVIRL